MDGYSGVDDASGSLSPDREEVAIQGILQLQVGIDPSDLDAVVDLAAVGFVNGCWRNSIVEDWHAGDGPLSDGDMLRINSHSTWRIRQVLRRWRSEIGLARGSDIGALDALDVNTTDRLASRIYRWMVNPSRRLPTGVTLGDIAGEDAEEFRAHVDGTMGGFAASCRLRGIQFSLWRAAAHGGLACRHWWGTPTWPPLVEAFLRALDNRLDPHWGPDGTWRIRLPSEPSQVADRTTLRRTLRNRPWQLDDFAANWVVNAGIGFLLGPIPTLPDDMTV